MKNAAHSLFVAAVIAAVLTAVVVGIVLLGPPSRERERRLDARRVDDLRGIAAAVDLYWSRTGALPRALADLSRLPGVAVSRSDPETGQPYEYRAIKDANYELCAVFSTSTSEKGEPYHPNTWAHGAGRTCFRLEARQVRP